LPLESLICISLNDHIRSPPGEVEIVLGVVHSARPQDLVLHDLRFTRRALGSLAAALVGD